MRLKISILSDSLARCRPLEGLHWEDVYPGMLVMNTNCIVHDKSKISADTSLFLERENLYYDIKYADSDYFVIHLGICDLSPRLFTKKEKLFIQLLQDNKLLKRFSDFFISHSSKRRFSLTKKRKVQNVSQAKFRENLELIIKEVICSNAKLKKIYIVNILDPGSFLINKSYGIREEVVKYNKEIDALCANNSDVCSVIDLFSFTVSHPEVVLADGHHLNKIGHQFIYETLKKSILQ